VIQTVYYCKRWFRAKKKPTELWPDDKAETAHRARQAYTALIGSAERPYCFVDVMYTFDRQGAVHIRREWFRPHRVETAAASFDPAPNHADWPDFGIHDDLVRVDRAVR
jgi:hypothetical protein